MEEKIEELKDKHKTEIVGHRFIIGVLLFVLLLSFLNTRQVRKEEYQNGYDDGYNACYEEYGL